MPTPPRSLFDEAASCLTHFPYVMVTPRLLPSPPLLTPLVRSPLALQLVSTAKTGYFYTTRKNPTKTTWKLHRRKYDPIVRKHVLFSEAKIK